VKQYSLDLQDKADLCIFAAAMFARVDRQGRVYESFLQQIHGKVKRMEEMHNAQPRTSLETAAMLENARPKYVAMSIQIVAEMYYGMSMAVFVSPATEYFITSDCPTVWFNPDAYKWPPLSRPPGLAQKKIEVTMPLTPKYALYLSHNEKIGGYRRVPAKAVQEINRRTRFHCDQWFIPWKGEIRQEWFDPGTPPDDRWENTPEGKRAAEEHTKLGELRRQDEERLSSPKANPVEG
jgi:Protein of unknown function (DUF4238)